MPIGLPAKCLLTVTDYGVRDRGKKCAVIGAVVAAPCVFNRQVVGATPMPAIHQIKCAVALATTIVAFGSSGLAQIARSGDTVEAYYRYLLLYKRDKPDVKPGMKK